MYSIAPHRTAQNSEARSKAEYSEQNRTEQKMNICIYEQYIDTYCFDFPSQSWVEDWRRSGIFLLHQMI